MADAYLAVPLDEEEEMAVNPAVEVNVQVFAVETSTSGLDEDESVTTIYVGEAKRAMTLALEILKQVRDKPGEAVEVKVSARVTPDALHCERLTEDEERVVHQRWVERMEDS